MNPGIVAQLKAAVGAGGFSEDPVEIAPHLQEWRGAWKGRTPLLLKPGTTEQVSRILAICGETATPVTPQGGNTGLVGGQIPQAGEILLSLERLNRIRGLDRTGAYCVAEAGVTLARLKEAAEREDMLFPLSLASEGSCTIGGNLSTNAGGVNVLRYGMARELALGLEVVLADGTVLDLLRTLRKDNTGYDLKQLFIGAEGTLGVITAAALKLYPRPAQTETAFVAVQDPAAAVELLWRLQAATGGLLSAFELIPRLGLDLALAHIPQTADPLRVSSPWYALVEASGAPDIGLRRAFEATLAQAISDGVAQDAALAESRAQRAALWRLRESLSEAQKREGPSLKHDIAVPIERIPDFIAKATDAVLRAAPGARPVSFGHLGDGNLHFNFSAPRGADPKAFLARREDVARIVHDLTSAYGGSISAEHGIGVMKRDELRRYKSPAEIELMKTLKRTLDPKNILNPGKVTTER
ncbi:MAG TPA: FAD-binding oxidoreductase [Rhizomicrobium sp.]|jgi:FAD/FMN-containing dehydrogenase|nr:FAD-binding oxidoreductase [Rhizomicrobium sp.]